MNNDFYIVHAWIKGNPIKVKRPIRYTEKQAESLMNHLKKQYPSCMGEIQKNNVVIKKWIPLFKEEYA